MMPAVSVVVPVFNVSDGLLRRCLQSVCAQTDPAGENGGIEIIVVDDGSNPACRRLAAEAGQTDRRLRYVRHWRNRGLVEARRTGCLKASGEYVLMVDADDELTGSDACAVLYGLAKRENADIVQCGARIMAPDNYRHTEKIANAERSQAPYEGVLENASVFENMFFDAGHCSFLWAKLVRRTVYLRALAAVPRVYCVQNEDFLQYFLIAYYAKKYVGIGTRYYAYYLGTGISSAESISSLADWKAICSSAKVFDVLWRFMETCPQKDAYAAQLVKYEQAQLFFILRRFHGVLEPSLAEDGWRLLCDAWGTQKVYQFNEEFKDSLLPPSVP